VHAVRAAGYRVLTYTVNDNERLRELEAWGVDGIITDAVDRIPADSLAAPGPLPPAGSRKV
jgi:glycerophosphoryl diester phosphodiesterase